MKKITALLLTILMLFPTPALAAEKQTFRLLTTPENEQLVHYVQEFCDQKKVLLEVSYMGDIDGINELTANSENYDAVWLSNSMWLYRLGSSVSVTDSKSTGIVPIVIGIRPELYDPEIKTMEDILALGGNFGIPSITRTNSGASSYLGIYSALCGSPRVLTLAQAKDEEIGAKVKDYISDNSTIYSDYEELAKLASEDSCSYFYGYESDFIRLNKEYGTTLKLIYLADGVPLSDKPFAYVDHKDAAKKELFLAIQKHLLTNDLQQQMCQDGVRTGYGGQVPYAKKDTFNPEWGIDTSQYLAAMNYPSRDVTTELLNFYTYGVSKPANYVFCLDYSGSMNGKGHSELVQAMNTLFNEQIASQYFIQMKETDLVTMIVFSDTADEGTLIPYRDFPLIPARLEAIKPGGGTNIYAALQNAARFVLPADSGYSNYVVLLTDGRSREDSMAAFYRTYDKQTEKFPIYSIMMGDADGTQLDALAERSGGKVFNGKTDLILAFKTLRGYN